MMRLEFRPFTVAVNREVRTAIAVDWIEQIDRIPGVEVFPGQTSRTRVMIAASDAGVTDILDRFPGLLSVEEPLLHKTA